MLWATWWEIVFFTTIGLFAVLVVGVTIGGFFDIRTMFRTIESQHDKPD